MSASAEVFAKYPNAVFIETGMGEGEGIQQALDAGFTRIYSIELSGELYNECVERFKDREEVILIWGDTTVELPKLLNAIDVPTTLWLDAHYSGGRTVMGDVASPLLRELDVIKDHPIKTHTILVDDLRDWNMRDHGFDTESIKEKILTINPDYKFSLEPGAIPNDILAATI